VRALGAPALALRVGRVLAEAPDVLGDAPERLARARCVRVDEAGVQCRVALECGEAVHDHAVDALAAGSGGRGRWRGWG
jgi:hypothetical protein